MARTSFIVTILWTLVSLTLAAAALRIDPAFGIPRAWEDRSMRDFRLPLAGLGHAPTLLSERAYYELPESNLKTYPVYSPDKEPPEYLDWLKKQKPQPLVDIDKLKTREDWIAAGREVFYGRELPRFSGSEHNLQLIRNPEVIKRYRLQATKEGVLLGLRYVVREQGKVELGTDTCAMCHVHVRPDGALIEGAPNNHTPFGPLMGDLTRTYARISPQMLEERRRKHMREDYRVPFLKDDPNLVVANLPAEEIATLYDRHPLGVHGRTNTSLLYPVKIANLIGINDMRYFDRTGTARNRNISDLMRYCGLVADVSDAMTRYGDGPNASMELGAMGLASGVHRTPDPLLYALAQYIYSLQPAANPNRPSALTARGKKVFVDSGCARCHTPPLYTNNRLTLAEGFRPSTDLMKHVNAMPESAGTDSSLALLTRKGTGFYRVPTLRMIWLDNCFLHDGALGSLEELFDPRRLENGFRPSNRPASAPPRPVKGHPFGLNLSTQERTALVAFLKTL
jgi:hypothetical protein